MIRYRNRRDEGSCQNCGAEAPMGNRGPVTRGTRTITDVRHLGAKSFEWLLTCGHVVACEQRPRDGQRSAVCETCRGGPANGQRSRGIWKAPAERHGADK